MSRCRECGAGIDAPSDLYFDDCREEIVVGDDRRNVYPMQWSLLVVFRSRLNRIVTKNFIFEAVYGYRDRPTTNAIDVSIHRLRRLLIGTPYRIVTIPSRGFRFEKVGDDKA